MRGYDAFAGVIKSGGKTRRAAKMVILNVDHPDVEEFITCKADEEKKAWALIDAGYDGAFNVKGGAYDSVFFQNANHSVRVTDEFMQAVVDDKDWHTRSVLGGAVCDTYRARDLMKLMSEAAWQCGDPGMQFDTTINDWHTCPATARINASNPCSEYMFLDDTACNLSSLNLMKFRREDGEFDAEAFKAACRTMLTAQEILVDNASYPTKSIERNSHDFRPLGLGYANLGVLLMDRGLPYDSDGGRAYAAAVTALMHGEAYAQSARIASAMGPFAGYAEERASPCCGSSTSIARPPTTIDATMVPKELMRHGAGGLGRGLRAGRAARLPQQPGHGAGPDRDHRLHDGLRHHRHRARHRARQVQEAGRRRRDEDRQPVGARRAEEARVLRRAGRGHHQVHRREGDDRGRAAPEGRAPRDLRLRLPAQGRQALDPLHGPHQDDGRGAAVPLRRHLQDRQHAERTPPPRRSATPTSSPGGWA